MHIDTHSLKAVLKRPELRMKAVNSGVGLPKLTHPSMIFIENKSLRYGTYILVLFSPLKEPLVHREHIRFNTQVIHTPKLDSPLLFFQGSCDIISHLNTVPISSFSDNTDSIIMLE
jgi:hypothetical protein